MAVDQKLSKHLRKRGPARDRFLEAHECKSDAIEDEDHGQCTICGAWMFLNCNGRWQRLHE